MTARTFSDIKLYAEHQPDSSVEDAGDGTKTAVELPGHVAVGVEIDGVRHQLASFKAGKFLSKWDAAHPASETDPGSGETPTDAPAEPATAPADTPAG
jgi:hypothetical protein